MFFVTNPQSHCSTVDLSELFSYQSFSSPVIATVLSGAFSGSIKKETSEIVSIMRFSNRGSCPCRHQDGLLPNLSCAPIH